MSLFAVAACLGAAEGAFAENTITWETLGNHYNAETGQTYVQRFTVNADAPFERVAFCAFKRQLQPVNPADTVIELLPGYYAVASDRFASAAPGEPVVIDLVTKGSLRNVSNRPDGMHLVADGKAVGARNVFKSTVADPGQYIVTDKDGVKDPMIYGPEAYAVNDSLRTALRPAAYNGIPTLKSIATDGRMVSRPTADRVKVVRVDDPRCEYFRAEIAGPDMTVYTNSAAPHAVVARLMRRIDEAADAAGMVPAAVIEDWADMPYRGLMIDVARNFTSADDMKRIIDLMSRYGLNVLHFHVGDDEGWRIEIPELPELTSVGARRGYCTDDNVPFLKQIYSGDGNPDSTDTPANGYYSVDEFIDLLQYAANAGVDIIPEFDTPGHSRAAIRAMEHRYRTTGDESLRLIHDGDTSQYTTAQDFHDNLMNLAIEGLYKFWDIVMGSLVNTYAKAGVPLRALHIGGDEVPSHAWDGSEAANRLMADKGMTHQRELHAYFVERVARIAARHGIKIAGWQEIALNHSDAYDNAVRPQVASVNCWTNTVDYGRQIASRGYPLILSNVDYLYFDQTPTTHPEEPGLTWGGLVDEFRPLHASVDRLCPASPEVQANVAGMSGHLFAETVRSRGMIERYILPRMLGLAERAHNKAETLSDAEYFGALTGQIALWGAEGIDHWLRQPGIRLNGGKVEMNDAYGLGEIRYTVDGSEPTRDSKLYTGPFDAPVAGQVRARLFNGPAMSVTSILYL